MKQIRPQLAELYNYCRKKIGEDEPYRGTNILGIHDILRAHFLIADHFAEEDNPVGLVGPRDFGLLHSAASRQLVSFSGHDKWKEETEVIATLFYGLIKDHPFLDGNKRTATLCALLHLSKCHRTPDVSHKEIEDLTCSVAENTLFRYPKFKKLQKIWKADADVQFLSRWFKANTREVDKRFYLITFQDLDTILERFAFHLENPRDNHIDIIQYKKVSAFLGLKKQEKRIKLGQIGFPGWTSQVGQGAINTVRKVTGLTPENGYDSQVFFRGVDDLYTLINIYSGLLRRLKDK